MRAVLIRLVALAAFAQLAACDSPTATDPIPSAAEPSPIAAEAAEVPTNADATADATADLGAQVFATRCAACHGPEGRGDGPAAEALDPRPVDLHGPRPAHLRGTPGGRRAIIENGSPGTAMIAWKDVLSPEELDAVYAVVHRMRHGDGTAPCAETDPTCDGTGPGMGRGRGMGGRRGMGRMGGGGQ